MSPAVTLKDLCTHYVVDSLPLGTSFPLPLGVVATPPLVDSILANLGLKAGAAGFKFPAVLPFVYFCVTPLFPVAGLL